MKTMLPLALTLALSAAPLAAQDDTPSKIEEGARLLLQGLLQELEPTLDQLGALTAQVEPSLRSFIDNMGPALRDLMTQVEDWSLYHPPEMRPNGDIILRRKDPVVPGYDLPEIEL